ncbi:MAG TPA: T9SS type A sorting domain-containing protein, partial [Saprospiraceae bacterium]|nr:T9SS type A sorting domain-containing protein [Saprospiraceae bacterium]
TLGFPDYPKLYVWPNAYILTVNEIVGGNVCSGFALERDAMLAGKEDFKVYRFVMPNFQAIQYQPATGADWEGGPPPPPGSPGYIFRVYDDAWDGGTDQIQLWEMSVDWDDVSKSKITGPMNLNPEPFETKVCFGPGLFDCIEQPGTLNRITALENIVMYRAPYRNFGTHESMVFNHVADVSGQVGDGGDAQVRWYEVRRKPGESWKIYQQGTYAPDVKTNRFMGTICMDEVGNIAIGYSVCSDEVFPGLRVSGRRVNDPLGAMPIQEYTLVNGGASHSTVRWGDYSNLAVDPEDGRTFWFTGEYQPLNQNWGTRIGSFRIQRDTYDLSPRALLSPQPNALLGDEIVTVEMLNGGISETETPVKLGLFLDGVLIVEDEYNAVIASGVTATHTFSKPIQMNVVGKTYEVMTVTTWAKDQFVKNDTLRTLIRKLTANDAAITGRANFPGLLCGTSSTVGIQIRNASGLPMTSARVRWTINNQPFQELTWTGNLAPDERDTVDLFLFNLNNGQNLFQAIIDQPNGLDDQDMSNDSLAFKFFGNTTGSYVSLDVESNVGLLHWELLNNANTLLSYGDLPSGSVSVPICTGDNTCYKLLLRSNTLNWQGTLRLRDFFGNNLAVAGSASQTPILLDFCTPQRKQIDVGAWALLSPLSGEGLTNAEPVKIAVRNFGLSNQNNVRVSYRVNNGPWVDEVRAGTVQQGQTASHTFATPADLSTFGANYTFDIKATLTNDQNTQNDARQVSVQSGYLREVALQDLTLVKGCENVSNVQVSLGMRNLGLQKVTKLRLGYTVNGTVQQPIDYTVNVFPSQSMQLPTAVIVGSQAGANELRIFVADVNGQGSDGVAANDTLVLNYIIDPLNLPLGVSFTTDKNPEQNSWSITDSKGNVVSSGGPYPNANFYYASEQCLREDSCFVFHLYDTSGDGFEGTTTLFSGGKTFWSYNGGNFGNELTFPFCNKGACTGFSIKANVVPDKPTPAPDGIITVVVVGGTQPFRYSINNGPTKSVPIFTGLAAGTYVVKCFDNSACIAELNVEVSKLSADIEPTPDSRSLSAYPNPTTGLLWLEMPAFQGERDAVCDVLDSRGRLLQSVRMSRWDSTLRAAIALDTYPAGIYLLQVRGLSRTFSKRVVKQ